MNYKKILTNVILVLCLSFGAALLLPTERANASNYDPVWSGCKASVGGYGVNNKKQAWTILNSGNKSCANKITIGYFNHQGKRIVESTGWYRQKTIGLTTKQQAFGKITIYYYVDAGPFGHTTKIYTIQN